MTVAFQQQYIGKGKHYTSFFLSSDATNKMLEILFWRIWDIWMYEIFV